MNESTPTPDAMVDQLVAAINRHDPEAIAACFGPDYRNETPAHPTRGFRGREQVRANWMQILAWVPDLQASVLRRSVDGSTVWVEWDWAGIRRNGTLLHMCGTVILGVADGLISWTRFYMEPVDESGPRVDRVIQELATG